MVMATILDLCKLGMMKGSKAEMVIANVFLTPDTWVQTPKLSLYESHMRYRYISSNGGHFEFMQIRYDERIQC